MQIMSQFLIVIPNLRRSCWTHNSLRQLPLAKYLKNILTTVLTAEIQVDNSISYGIGN